MWFVANTDIVVAIIVVRMMVGIVSRIFVVVTAVAVAIAIAMRFVRDGMRTAYRFHAD